MWLSLSVADAASGCMRMVPGSYKQGVIGHETTVDENNMLLQFQTVRDLDESGAVLYSLQSSDAPSHHG